MLHERITAGATGGSGPSVLRLGCAGGCFAAPSPARQAALLPARRGADWRIGYLGQALALPDRAFSLRVERRRQ
eukprot:2713424-Alexandrium_andersonii.AAC.2